MYREPSRVAQWQADMQRIYHDNEVTRDPAPVTTAIDGQNIMEELRQDLTGISALLVFLMIYIRASQPVICGPLTGCEGFLDGS